MSKHIQTGQQRGGSPIVFKSGDPISVICVASTFTSLSYANNGGKVQITSSGVHGLTTSPAVGAKVYVSWVGGTGVSGLYTVLSVDSTTAITVDLVHVADLGTPTVAIANTEIAFTSYVIPPLAASSKIKIMWGVEVTPSTNFKSIFAKLNTTAMVAQTIVGSSTILASQNGMISNCGVINVQRGTWLCSVPGTRTTSDFSVGAVDTSISTTLAITGRSLAANEIIKLEMYLFEVFI